MCPHPTPLLLWSSWWMRVHLSAMVKWCMVNVAETQPGHKGGRNNRADEAGWEDRRECFWTFFLKSPIQSCSAIFYITHIPSLRDVFPPRMQNNYSTMKRKATVDSPNTNLYIVLLQKQKLLHASIPYIFNYPSSCLKKEKWLN